MNGTAAMPLDGLPTMEADEAALIRAAQQDPAAFTVLYGRYRQRIYAYLRARADNGEDAADLTQQVFLQALAGLPRYRERGGAFASWLFRIAHNAAANDRRRRGSVALEAVPEPVDTHAGHNPEAVALRDDDLARLRALVGTLSPETRELLALRYAGGLTTPEIAAVVGKSEAATRKRLFRALQALKEQYHDEA